MMKTRARRRVTTPRKTRVRSAKAAEPFSRNDEYFKLWQRLLDDFAKALRQVNPTAKIDRLDRLATRLAQAQQRGTLPRTLVKEILPRSRGGPVR